MSNLIDREAALACFHDWVDRNGDIHTADEMPEYQRIEALPSVEPERKKGHWIEVDDDRIRGKCSVCGWEAHLYEDDVVGMDYCPNCGARLEE